MKNDFLEPSVLHQGQQVTIRKKKRRYFSNNCADRWLYPKRDLLYLVPQLSGFLLFYVYAFIVALRYSMLDNNARMAFVGIKHYMDVINNPYYQLALMNTIKFSFLSVLISLVIGYVLALLVFWHSAFRWVTNLGMLAFFLPSSALMMIWRILMSQHGTIANALYVLLPNVFSLNMWPEFSLYAFFIWRYLGVSILIYLSGLFRIEYHIIEAARLEGAGSWLISRSILLPLLTRTSMFNLVFMTVFSLRMFREVYLLYGAYPPQNLYFVQHYLSNHFARLNYQRLSAAAVLLAAFLSMLFMLIIHAFQKREQL